MADTTLGFNKAERMVSNRDIEKLFSSGSKSLSVFPLRVVFRRTDRGTEPLIILISVAKRRLHHAVDRNRAKRQIREAYRKHKEILRTPLVKDGKCVHMAFIWMSDTPQTTTEVEQGMIRLLQLLTERL